MGKISSIDLYKAKENCLELMGKSNRLVLKGNNPILLTATLFTENDIEPCDDNLLTNIEVFANYYSNSYIDAMVMYLNEVCGVHGIIDYLPIDKDIVKMIKQLNITRQYNDPTFGKYILDNNIKALLSFKLDSGFGDELVSVNEAMSSFNFMGITGISNELSQRLKKAGYSNHMGIDGKIDLKKFNQLGYDFIDEVILYNKFTKIGSIKGELLEQKKMWPRTVELGIKASDDTYELEKIGAVLIDYFLWIQDELKEKGQYNAMSPKVYKKN